MKYQFKPNTRIKLKQGDFETPLFRAKSKLGAGAVQEESEAIVQQGKRVFEFYNLADRDVLDGTEWRIISEHGITYKFEFAEPISGNLVRVVAEIDSSAPKLNITSAFIGFSIDLAWSFDPVHVWGVLA